MNSSNTRNCIWHHFKERVLLLSVNLKQRDCLLYIFQLGILCFIINVDEMI